MLKVEERHVNSFMRHHFCMCSEIADTLLFKQRKANDHLPVEVTGYWRAKV